MHALTTIEHETGPAPAASVIWLHGLGADGRDFEPAVPLADPGFPVRFVFPDAPLRPVTVNGGAVMRAWYDIESLGGRIVEDEAGLEAGAAAVAALVDAEVGRGVPPSRVALVGFSQGGAMALHAGLRHPARLAGLAGLSCYLPAPQRLPATGANLGQRIFLAHGEFDPVVPAWIGRAGRDALAAAGHRVEWHEYAMPHTVVPAELAALRDFLARVLGGGSAPEDAEARR